ncbi:MAG: AbrB/MazE/SpoVT family DNA-binding domain-containing protein [Rhodospirillales bacterium]|nr:MAG: AbrB/MazE/SpoVT family DNA-binding domain-containing protein [Rhodospirillales bacterium]
MRHMNNITARIGQSGRLVIPASYRKALGVKPGDDVMMQIENGELRILSVERAIERAQETVRRYAKGQPSLSDLLLAERKDETARD